MHGRFRQNSTRQVQVYQPTLALGLLASSPRQVATEVVRPTIEEGRIVHAACQTTGTVS